ncbi:phenylacetate--CoA ligase family protein [Saccharicrinis aurantiacus]|uniref:phenylacetate--CoA ligase family protein n=1 Tax=Saccharicrinis aurantiacus TaxID=1849719 RepID=UPI000838F0BE|nr:phenylacetate--CoA ligase family protein [Saccharicrinis aurantiacus]
MTSNIYVFFKESFKSFIRSKLFIYPYLKELETVAEMSTEEIKHYEDQKFIKIFRTAYRHSQFYRQLYLKNGIQEDDINGLDDINKLPIISKKDIQRNSAETITTGRLGLISTKTSGTTGAPLKLLFSLKFILRDYAYIHLYRKRIGCLNSKIVSIRGNLGRNILKQYVFTNKTLYLSSYNIKSDTCIIYYKLIKKFSPKVIEGYPSSLYNLALFLKEKQLYLSIPIAFTSSETLFPYQRDLIERIFGTKIYDIYGNTERTISLRQNLQSNQYFAPAGYSHFEICEFGLLTTNLNNKTFPLIRYIVEDKVIPATSNETYDSFYPRSPRMPNIERIEGRCEDVIIGIDGTKYGRLNFLIKGHEKIKVAQIIQKQIGDILIHVVPDTDYSKEDERSILDSVAERIGIDNINCRIIQITESEIIYSKNNKFRFVVSLIDDK